MYVLIVLVAILSPAYSLPVYHNNIYLTSCGRAMGVQVTRNSRTHQGSPYIAMRTEGMECPVMQPQGPNRWTTVWSLEQMMASLCGNYSAGIFRTKVVIDVCDCPIHTGDAFTAVLECVLPESVEMTLAGEKEKSKEKANPDQRSMITVPMPLIHGKLTRKNGTTVGKNTSVKLGEEMNLELTMMNDRGGFWQYFAVNDLTASTSTDSMTKVPFISNMCRGAIKQADSGSLHDILQNLPASLASDRDRVTSVNSVKKCDKCEHIVNRLAFFYNPTKLHRKTISIPFRAFRFEADHLTNLTVSVQACSALSSGDKCRRYDCPGAPVQQSHNVPNHNVTHDFIEPDGRLDISLQMKVEDVRELKKIFILDEMDVKPILIDNRKAIIESVNMTVIIIWSVLACIIFISLIACVIAAGIKFKTTCSSARTVSNANLDEHVFRRKQVCEYPEIVTSEYDAEDDEQMIWNNGQAYSPEMPSWTSRASTNPPRLEVISPVSNTVDDVQYISNILQTLGNRSNWLSVQMSGMTPVTDTVTVQEAPDESEPDAEEDKHGDIQCSDKENTK